MPYAIVISVLIASIAYLIPRLVTLKVNMDQLKRAEELQALQFNGEDTITESSGSEGLFGTYV